MAHPSATPSVQRRILELDGVRGLAAILVVLFHAFPRSIFFWGWSGVDLFFVLSGFLITTIILAQCKTAGFLRSFYLRRVFRIWPVYYLTLAGVLLVNRFSAAGFSVGGLMNHVFFLQNCQKYLGLPVPGFVGTFWPSWSVAVEEQFYLFWPLLLPMLGRRGIPFFSVALLAISLGGRFLLPSTFELLGTRGDGLAFGCFLAWLLDRSGNDFAESAARRFVLFAGVVGGGYVAAFLSQFWLSQNPGWALTRFTGFSLVFSAVIGGCVLSANRPWLAPLRHPILRWFGTISYAMYLFHLPILAYTGTLLARIGIRSEAVQTASTWFLIVGLPAASWYFLERPILRWKESLIASRPEPDAILQTTRTVPPPLS